jgi:cell division protein FtsI (penicillin-binding protein 3)
VTERAGSGRTAGGRRDRTGRSGRSATRSAARSARTQPSGGSTGRTAPARARSSGTRSAARRDRAATRPAARRPAAAHGGRGGRRGHQGAGERDDRGGPRSRGAGPVGRLRSSTPRTRSFALLAGLIVLFLVVVTRLVYVQTIGAAQYVAYGVEQRIEPIELAGGRGAIYDRNGDQLAMSIPQTTIAADPSIVEDPQDAARRLAPVLGVDENTLLRQLTDDVRFVYLKRQVPDDVAEAVEALDIPGVLLFGEQARLNPSEDLAAALLGSVDPDSVGTSGVEQTYEDQLSGEPGHLVVERDPEGRTIPAGRHQIDPARPGDDLILTLDRSLQWEVERILSQQISAVGAKGGIVIVSNPETGEILAMANQETDPATGVVHNTTNDLAVTANYEPGSVNKVITLAAALEEGLVTPEQVVQVPSSLQVADHTYSDSHPGNLTVTDVLAKSSNVGTIKIAQLLGEDRLDEYLRRFGFGRDTGLGLPHEENGQVPPLDDWSGTSIGSIPLGQGISVTAMQMLFAYNVIANDGVYVPPALVAATRDSEGERHETPPGASRRVVSPTTAEQMRAMLTEVIDHGTGTAAAIDGYDAAGKTGTARKPQEGGGYQDAAGNYHYISTFAGFLPADDPKLSVIVVIDEPSTSPYAATVAAPAFAEIGRYAARTMGVAPGLVPPAPPLAIDTGGGRVRATPAAAQTTVPPTTVAPDPAAAAPPTTATPDPAAAASGAAATPGAPGG